MIEFPETAKIPNWALKWFSFAPGWLSLKQDSQHGPFKPGITLFN